MTGRGRVLDGPCAAITPDEGSQLQKYFVPRSEAIPDQRLRRWIPGGHARASGRAGRERNSPAHFYASFDRRQ